MLCIQNLVPTASCLFLQRWCLQARHNLTVLNRFYRAQCPWFLHSSCVAKPADLNCDSRFGLCCKNVQVYANVAYQLKFICAVIASSFGTCYPVVMLSTTGISVLTLLLVAHWRDFSSIGTVQQLVPPLSRHDHTAFVTFVQPRCEDSLPLTLPLTYPCPCRCLGPGHGARLACSSTTFDWWGLLWRLPTPFSVSECCGRSRTRKPSTIKASVTLCHA